MNEFRKILIRLREEYNKDAKALYLKAAGAMLLCIIIGLVIDLTLPMSGWPTFLRSTILIPTAIAIFVFAYILSLKIHDQRIENNPDWTPYRSRFSPSWRLRLSGIIFAILVVTASSIPKGVGYTFNSSCIGAVVIAAIAFLRRSKAEADREELGIPDARDIIYDAKKREFERIQEQKKASKEKKKSSPL